MATVTTKIVRVFNADLPARAQWAERATWEAQRLLDAAKAEEGLNAAVVDWGVDPTGDVLWLNIDSGEFNMDLAITREFFEFHGFRDRAKQFLSHVRRIHPTVFSQNGVGRHLGALDLQSDEGVDVFYEGGQRFRDFSEEKKREEAESAAQQKTWEAEEKARKEVAKERAQAAKAAAAAAK